MRIGILTYHFVSNFGANLQTLSTFCYFKKVGHDPIIINWIPEDLERYYEKVVPAEQNDAFHRFAQERYSNITRICRSSKDVANVIDGNMIDLVVVGSDAVLTYIPIVRRFRLCRKGIRYSKPCIDSDFPNAFWGDFLSYTKRPVKMAIMSGSAQNTRYSDILFHKKRFNEALHKFSFISVRDIWTKKMVGYLTNGELDVNITPDPVFAFNYNVDSQFSKKYIIERFGLDEDYALLTVDHDRINAQWKKQLEVEFKNKGIVLYELPQANKPPKDVLSKKLRFPIDPIEWYCLIKYARAYIGELMHPVLVALHNAVPLYVVDTYGFKSKGEMGFNTESSKTFQIIARFKLLSNYYNVNSRKNIDSPLSVIEKIMSFDRSLCKKHADIMLQDYLKMMNKIQTLD